jgi:stage II sporulation protein AA (anti-sigma F factor antagonist)
VLSEIFFLIESTIQHFFYIKSFILTDKGFFILRSFKMAIRIEKNAVRLTVYLSGEIDHHNAAVLRCETDDAVQAALVPTVRLDFGNVTFMDSSGIGFVLGRYKIIESYGGALEVVNLSSRLYMMMKLAGLEKLVKLRMKG